MFRWKREMMLGTLVVFASLPLTLNGFGEIVKTSPQESSQIESRDVAKKKRACIAQLMSHAALDATYRGIKDELSGKDVDLIYKNAQGDPRLVSQVAKDLSGQNCDVVVTIATTMSQAVKAAIKKAPIVCASISDMRTARLVKNLEHPEGLVTGVTSTVPFEGTLDLIVKMLAERVVQRPLVLGVLYNTGEPNSISVLEIMKKAVAAYKNVSVTLVFGAVTKTSEVPDATRHLLSKKVDAIVINSDNTALSVIEGIQDIAQKSKIPVFSSDTDSVARGAVAARGPDQYLLGRQAGRMARKILNGESPGKIGVQSPQQIELHLNHKTARRLELKIPEEILTDAHKTY